MTAKLVIASAALLVALALGSLNPTATAEQLPASSSGQTLPATRACADLGSVDLSEIGGAASRIVQAGEDTTNGVVACRVKGVLAPSITFEAILPTGTWTGRYLQLGCGGLCGRISLQVGAADGCVPLQAGGFVVAATDMGHDGMGGEFGRDPQKREDFAFRAQHVTALAVKTLIRVFYGRSESFAYFSGCSDGGREALVEAQRFPEDFNGIIAGAPALNFQVQNTIYHAWMARANMAADGKPILLAGRLPPLHQAVLAQCDGLDGQIDGLIANPRACQFDATILLCKDQKTASGEECFSDAEVETIRRFYDGPRDPATGMRLTIGGPQPGSELSWAGVFVPLDAKGAIFSRRIAMDAIRNLSFDPNPPDSFQLSDFRFDLDTFARLRARHPLFDATNPDLKGFAAAGRKLILWQGWSDEHISPVNLIAYHQAVRSFVGSDQTDAFERLYLFPGMAHCGGGDGFNTMDLLTPMIDWVERGVAPDAIMARHAERRPGPAFGAPGGPPPGSMPPRPPAPEASRDLGIRPVYPYPKIAVFDGHGDPRLPGSYRPEAPTVIPLLPAWAGSDFFRPPSTP